MSLMALRINSGASDGHSSGNYVRRWADEGQRYHGERRALSDEDRKRGLEAADQAA